MLSSRSLCYSLILLLFSSKCQTNVVTLLSAVNFRWCARPADKAKCTEFIKYVEETAKNKSLNVSASCVDGSDYDDCVTKIKSNKADFVTLDGGKVYEAGMLLKKYFDKWIAYNCFASALHNFVSFLAVVCQKTTWNEKVIFVSFDFDCLLFIYISL